jgi:S1-C subfamily serine protease
MLEIAIALQIDAPINPGNPGGPLNDERRDRLPVAAPDALGQ